MGARLLFYTDGIVEARNREGDFFQLAHSSLTLRTGEIGDALDGLLRDLNHHVGHEINDDVALVLVERRDAPAGLRQSGTNGSASADTFGRRGRWDVAVTSSPVDLGGGQGPGLGYPTRCQAAELRLHRRI